MEVVDNKRHILGAIKRQSDREIKSLEDEFNAEIKELKSLKAAQLKEQLASLDEAHAKRLEKIERQTESSMDLLTSHKTLTAHAKAYRAVIARVHELFEKDPERLCKIMVERLKKSQRKLVEIHVPKGVSLAGTVADIDGAYVVGVINENEELEIRLDDLIYEHHARVHDIIMHELFA